MKKVWFILSISIQPLIDKIKFYQYFYDKIYVT
jgi:hypothetical protein